MSAVLGSPGLTAGKEVQCGPAPGLSAIRSEPATNAGSGGEEGRRLATLMRAAHKGDYSAYREFLLIIRPLIRGVIRRRRSFLQAHDVEDLVQEVLVALHSAHTSYDPDRPFLPWLVAITRNRLADHARRHIRRSQAEVPVEYLSEASLAEVPAYMDTDLHGDLQALGLAINNLPPGQRQAIHLLKLREASLKEASRLTGMSVSALKVAVHRAMKSLRTALNAPA